MHSRQFSNNSSQFKIIGFADDDPAKQGMLVESTPVLGQTQDISRIVRDYQIDLIVLAIHNIASPGFRRIVDICQHTEARVKVMPDVMKALTRSFAPEYLRDIRIEDIIGRPDIPHEIVTDKEPIIGKVLLVTGAAGSIGSELVRQLIYYAPRNLLLLDNNESGLYDLVMELKRSVPAVPVSPVLCDVSDQHALRQLFKEHSPQIVFHAAAYKHVPMLEDHPYQAVRVNIRGSFNVASLAQEYKVERFVSISSDKAVNAENVMGATKYICERVVRSLAGSQPEKTPLISVVRFGNVLGSRGSVVPLFERQIETGGPVTVTDERMTRYFMSISEAAHLVIQAACMTKGGDLFILEMGESVRIVELAERMIRLRGLRPYQDIPIKFTGMRPGETLHEKLLVAGETRRSTSHPYIFSVETPMINAETFMKEVACLLEKDLTGDVQVLKQKVLDLAQHAQQETR